MDDFWNLPGMWLLEVRRGRVLRASVHHAVRFPAEPAAGLRWTEALALADADGAEAWFRRAAEAKDGEGGVLLARSGEGGRCLRLRLHAGRVLQVEDATGEHAELERMRLEGAHFHALIERSAEGISVFDTRANILYESPSNKRIHGYESTEMVGRNLFDFCHPDDMARVMPRFSRLAEGPGMIETDIVRFRHKAGHYLYLEGVVLNATDDPCVGGLVNNFRDVTGRIEAERELRRAKGAAEEAHRLQRHFLANLSHEFKTPLTLIRGPITDFSEGRVAAESAPRTLGIVLRNIDRLDALLTELIDLARLDSGTFALRVSRRDLAAHVRRLAELFTPLADARAIRLCVEAGSGCDVFFDAGKIDKIVGNLIGNALKFSPSGTRIVMGVRARPGAGRAEVFVRDQGPGMDEATRLRVFERFFQGEAGLARAHEGMGIGLAIAREMVELHGGELRVESAPGAGSTFEFWLPLGCDHLDPDDIDLAELPEPRPHTVGICPGAPSFGEAPEPDAALHRPRLLLVEDNTDMRSYLRMQLDPHYLVREAVNGMAALAALEAFVPDIILSDVMMPGLDGLELCRRVRGGAHLAKTPVVLLSAKGSADHRVEGLRAGADDYLAKPFSVSELLQRLKIHLPEEAGAKAGRGDEWTGRLHGIVDANLGDSDFDVAQLARMIGYSNRQFQRRVLAHLGVTPATLLLKRRLARARELVDARRHETMAEVARAVGLSPGYFSRRYRKEYGCAEIGL